MSFVLLKTAKLNFKGVIEKSGRFGLTLSNTDSQALSCVKGLEIMAKRINWDKKPKNKIREVSINWETGDATFYFEGCEAPWSTSEFKPKSLTRSKLARVEAHIAVMFAKIKREDKAIAAFVGKQKG